MTSPTMSFIRNTSAALLKLLDYATPLLDLVLRLWVANVFFRSGRSKIASWDSTLELFRYEYQVPLFSPEFAAYSATFFELTMPVLLALGLAGRKSAFVLFVLNYVAMISYPDISPAGIQQHILWGAMLAVTFFHGPGKLSLDHLIRKRVLGD